MVPRVILLRGIDFYLIAYFGSQGDSQILFPKKNYYIIDYTDWNICICGYRPNNHCIGFGNEGETKWPCCLR